MTNVKKKTTKSKKVTKKEPEVKPIRIVEEMLNRIKKMLNRHERSHDARDLVARWVLELKDMRAELERER